jgi:hypothetical protein
LPCANFSSLLISHPLQLERHNERRRNLTLTKAKSTKDASASSTGKPASPTATKAALAATRQRRQKRAAVPAAPPAPVAAKKEAEGAVAGRPATAGLTSEMELVGSDN